MSIEQWSDLMFPEREGTVTPIYGSVRAINDDGSYEVQLNASSVTTRCAPCCTAMVGDRVLVLIKPNGKCDAIGRLGGDLGGGGTIVTQYDDVSNYIAGRVFAYAGADEPIGCLLCDGRAVSRTTYWELFGAIGTTYGAGDGSTTFNLPNIESRTIIGESDSYALGSTGGEEKHTLTVDELPDYELNVTSTNGGVYSDYVGDGASSAVLYSPRTYATGYASPLYADSGGSNQPHNNMQPYIVMRYFITTGKGDPVSGINPADYVVEWGTTGNWNWRKYASGWAECWLSETYTFNLTNDLGAGWYYSDEASATLPFAFTSVAQMSGSIGSGFAYNFSRSDNRTIFFYATYPGWYENYTADVSIYVVGWWKDSPASGGTETIAPTIAERFEALENEAPIASGTSGDWAWIKFASGLALLFLYVIPPNANGHVAQGVYGYPFPMKSVFGQVATINDNGGNAYGALTATVKAINATDALLLSLHSVDAYFNSWLPPVTAVVIGRWK